MKALPTELRWTRSEGGEYKSQCGRYTIRRDGPRQWHARCWRESGTGAMSWSGTFPTLRDAKRRCALDARHAAEVIELYRECYPDSVTLG